QPGCFPNAAKATYRPSELNGRGSSSRNFLKKSLRSLFLKNSLISLRVSHFSELWRRPFVRFGQRPRELEVQANRSVAGDFGKRELGVPDRAVLLIPLTLEFVDQPDGSPIAHADVFLRGVHLFAAAFADA